MKYGQAALERSERAWHLLDLVINSGVSYRDIYERIGYAKVDYLVGAHDARKGLPIAKCDAITALYMEKCNGTAPSAGNAAWDRFHSAAEEALKELNAITSNVPPGLLNEKVDYWRASLSEMSRGNDGLA